MPAETSLVSKSLILEIENGTKSSGEILYRKKTFSGLNPNATPEDLLVVAKAIKAVLANNTGRFLESDLSELIEV